MPGRMMSNTQYCAWTSSRYIWCARPARRVAYERDGATVVFVGTEPLAGGPAVSANQV